MTKIEQERPARRRIGFVIHAGFQALDVVGPIAAFEIASRDVTGGSDVEIIAPDPGPVQSSSGLTLTAAPSTPTDSIPSSFP